MADRRQGTTRSGSRLDADGRLIVAEKHDPPIVAELGRPETPEETAARKAENSRKHRASQTTINLVLSIAASLAVVLALVLVVVRPDQPPREPIDYALIAEQSQDQVDAPLATPTVPADWAANAARLESVDGVETWYIGFITGSEQFIALNQGIDANETWQSNLLESARETGTMTIAGTEWTVFDRRDVDDPGNIAFALTTTIGDSWFVLHGTARDAEFETLAASLTEDHE